MNTTLEPHELIIADDSRAFLHAEIDDEVFVQPPPEVDGIKINVGSSEITRTLQRPGGSDRHCMATGRHQSCGKNSLLQ